MRNCAKFASLSLSSKNCLLFIHICSYQSSTMINKLNITKKKWNKSLKTKSSPSVFFFFNKMDMRYAYQLSVFLTHNLLVFLHLFCCWSIEDELISFKMIQIQFRLAIYSQFIWFNFLVCFSIWLLRKMEMERELELWSLVEQNIVYQKWYVRWADSCCFYWWTCVYENLSFWKYALSSCIWVWFCTWMVKFFCCCGC